MKTKIILLLTTVSTLSLSAQENNRLDDIGKQYLPSIALIKADVENGKVTEINQETIDYYAKTIRLQTEMNLQLANRVFEIKKGGPVKFGEYLANATDISEEAKDLVSKICDPRSPVDETNYQDYYKGLVGDIEKTAISSGEKDMLLALNSIAYHVNMDRGAFKAGGVDNNHLWSNKDLCFVEGEGGAGYMDATTCVILSAGIGFIAGFQTCGLWCGIGGAVLFGVVAAVSLC